MKTSRVFGVLVAGLVLACAATQALAWDNMNYDVSKLGVETIQNPVGTEVLVNDKVRVASGITVNSGGITVTGNVTCVGTLSGNGANITNVTAQAIDAAKITAGTAISAINGAAITNLNGENIQAGTIDDDALDFTDITGADRKLSDVGALTTFGATTLGGETVAITNNATIAGTLTYVGTPAVDIALSIAHSADGATNVVTCTAKDKSGATIAQRTLFRLWIADTAFGAIAAVDGDVVVSDAVELQEVVDNGDYWIVTGANGIATVTVTATPAVTNFIHAVVGGGAIRTAENVFVAE